jgi:DNA-binding transcriptional ArsR family regulator
MATADTLMSFAAVAKHLRVLVGAGLVTRGREAQYRPAALDVRPLEGASAWLGDYRVLWAESFDALDAVLGELTGPGMPAEGRSTEARGTGTHHDKDT